MLPRDPSPAVDLAGSPRRRGVLQRERGGAGREAVATATLGRLDAARAEGILDAAALGYLAAQREFAVEHAPECLDELDGVAEAWSIGADDLFAHLHLGILRDRRQAAASRIPVDGCSAFAVGAGPDGPIVVKNRDFAGSHRGVQRVFRHEGPDLAAGPMLCVGSLGSPGAYSSGMNAAGLALVDTQVATGDHGVGWLRYFLMTRVLATCRTVEEAVAFVAAAVHAGGGTLVLADRSGAVAALELGHRVVAVDRAGTVFRTNHFVSPELSGETLGPEGDAIAGTSLSRRAFLAARVPGRPWSAEAAAELMASHSDDEGRGPLCQHGADGADGGSSTISSAVFVCGAASLYLSNGNPCGGDWRLHRLAP